MLAALWQAGWLAAAILAGVALSAAGLLGLGRGTAALTVGAAPALWALMLTTAPRNAALQISMIVMWALGGALASLLTGGLGGPLGAWCLGPLAAAVFMRRGWLLALGGAASLAAGALSALGAAALAIRPPSPELASALGLLALATVAGGLTLGLAGAVGRASGAQDARMRLLDMLGDQGLLLLYLTEAGEVEEAFGAGLLGIGDIIDGRVGLGEAAAPADRDAVGYAFERAQEEGQAQIGFAPVGAPSRWIVAHLQIRPDGGVAALLSDATAQRERERELQREREDALRERDLADSQNAGKSRFLANMSHELRTPLNAIMGFSDIMRQRLFGPLSDRYGEYAELVHESGSHLLELINDILDMSKIEAERYELAVEEFDARDAVSAVLRLMRGQADRAGVQLRGVLPRGPLEVNADRRAIKQMALNLISNALKFTPKDGSVTVTAQATGRDFELIVADTGVGISPEDMARLGNPYEQAGGYEQRAAGTGLGLSLVRAFSKLHGGEMTMESTLGEGTTVTVRLPVMVPAAAVEAAR